MSKEAPARAINGWLMVVPTGVLALGGLALTIWSATQVEAGRTWAGWVLAASLVGQLLGWMLAPGFFALQPNEARVLVLFGSYRGTIREPGFHWGNPFYSNVAVDPRRAESAGEPATKGRPGTRTGGLTRFKVSLRARTLQGEHLKVNDRRGNPVEIGAMVVWRVADTAQAVFDVEDFRAYVRTQAETALRHVATEYAYDKGDDDDPAEVTLRGNPDEVAAALRADLARRLAVAGCSVEDTRLTHLAYAPEIAQAMLRRQQAEAVIAARRKIVSGAVGMVELAARQLQELPDVRMSSEATAAMVGNLMVVLCSESDVQPVLNTGSVAA